MDVDLHADLVRLDEVASKVAMMRASAEKVLEDICSPTTGFLAEVSSSIKHVDAAWQSARNHIPDNARTAIVSDFVKFLTDSLDVRNTAGLSQLVQAFVDHDTATVDAFIANSINVVVFAKAAAAVVVKHEDTTVQDSKIHDVELFASALDRSLGKAFANNKWLRVVAREPWTDWSNAFVPFLPGHSPGQVALNGELQAFFIVHGRAMWERYFYLGTSLDPRNTMPSKRFRRLRASFGELVQSLYALEGVDVFLFLEAYRSGHRSCSTRSRWTRRFLVAGYWAPPVEATTSLSHEYGFEKFEPMACLDWMGKTSLLQDKWISPNFVAKLFAEIEAKRPTFDAAQSPNMRRVHKAKHADPTAATAAAALDGAVRQFERARDDAVKAIDTLSSSVANVAEVATSTVSPPDRATLTAQTVDDFVKYLVKRFDVSNLEGLTSLAKAFVFHPSEKSPQVDAVVANGLDVVLHARRCAAQGVPGT
ncbi:hypothetical protein B5M09_006157, partial [Aphanomyces astaci]